MEIKNIHLRKLMRQTFDVLVPKRFDRTQECYVKQSFTNLFSFIYDENFESHNIRS